MPHSYPNAPERQNSVMGVCTIGGRGPTRQRPSVSRQRLHHVHLYLLRNNNYARRYNRIKINQEKSAYIEHVKDDDDGDDLIRMSPQHKQDHKRLGGRVGAN